MGPSLGAPSSAGWPEQRDRQPEPSLPCNCLFLLDRVCAGGEGREAERQRHVRVPGVGAQTLQPQPQDQPPRHRYVTAGYTVSYPVLPSPP